MKKGEFITKLENVSKLKESEELREFVKQRQAQRKALGIRRDSEAIRQDEEILIKADLLEGESGFVEEDKTIRREQAQLDDIEAALSVGELSLATDLFDQFLQDSYDNTNTVNKNMPRCTGLWLVRHYVAMNGNGVFTRSDVLASRLLNMVEQQFTGGRSSKVKAYNLTKEEREEVGFSFKQLQRLNCIFDDFNNATGIGLNKFLDLIEDFATDYSINKAMEG